MRRSPSVQCPWTVIKTKLINMRRQRQGRLKKRLNSVCERGCIAHSLSFLLVDNFMKAVKEKFPDSETAEICS